MYRCYIYFKKIDQSSVCLYSSGGFNIINLLWQSDTTLGYSGLQYDPVL